MTEMRCLRFLSILLILLFLQGAAGPLLASPETAPAASEGAQRLSRLETAALLRGRGIAHEDAGRLENAVRNYEESLLFFPDAEVSQRIDLLKKTLAERTAPLSPPAPLLPEARVSRLEKARALREDGKNAFVRGELHDAARFFEESLSLFEDPELSRFAGAVKNEIELASSLEGLEELFD